ncbi:type III-A CRISPR-associated protein Cas10/Csm1 [Streptococcus cristatus]|uniref:CRISPR system single-strand-specific deoxyribonuclease Cas10/Csm1 (subtype III-A) n=1 Tax=Streptococcus cristatus TaxID=45634 RepID=A0A139MZL8_STRCR|nr:type III-A CRISPR-associated protein Cas10/Csm1 [Streptococcus cristatus]KXT69132.1 CRISPR-associated protein, Csm1 family [Streptococcus cristatus]
MKKEKIDLIYCALFHNLGRIVSRSLGQSDDIDVGKAWLKEQLPQLDLYEDSRAEQIISLASRIASGVDAGIPEVLVDGFKPLADIFNTFKEDKGSRYQKFEVLTDDSELNIASHEAVDISQDCYEELLNILTEKLQELPLEEESLPSFFNLWRILFSKVPLLPGDKDLGDLSLAEHSRLTVAFATVIFDYLENQGQDSLLDDASNLYTEFAFLLASFDLSGIQDFIYNIASKGAAKQLKARSLYLDFMSEHIVDSLLEQLALSRANALYVGGGHAYFILPNTAGTEAVLKEFEAEFNSFLLKHFQTGLYVAFGWAPFAAEQMMKPSKDSAADYLKNYREIYQQTSRMISEKKISRYDAATLQELNKGGKQSERECEICHAVGDIEELRLGDEDAQNLCPICRELRWFAAKIHTSDDSENPERRDYHYFQIVEGEKGLPIGPGAVLQAVVEENSSVSGRLYVKNKPSANNAAIHVFIGDRQAANIEEYAGMSQKETEGNEDVNRGIKRLAVLRLDVDNLGAAFMAGFSEQDGGRYNTLARSAVFSQQMSLFFKFHINQFAEDKNLTIIYAGGDDVFAIGSWQDVIKFAVEIRQKFIAFTNGKLTLSAGVGLYPDKTPIHLMALDAGQLEEAAKDNGKDSISVFNERYTFKFNDFIDGIYKGKLEDIRRYFSGQKERGIAFLYRLVELLQLNDEAMYKGHGPADDRKMNVARLAYLLARMEDEASKEEKEHFREFKNAFWDWYKSSRKTQREAELALIYYLYEIRKEQKDDAVRKQSE